jgi:hypothetical protein
MSDEKDNEIEIIERHVAAMMEHFDSCQVICTRTVNRSTELVQAGGGNWYARTGAVREWMYRNDIQTQIEIKENGESEN